MSVSPSQQIPVGTPLPVAADRSAHRAPPSVELEVVLEMLSTLDTLTAAGQRHLMSRLIEIMHSHAPNPGTRHGPDTLTGPLGLLARESEKRWPDVRAFAGAASTFVMMLKEAASGKEPSQG